MTKYLLIAIFILGSTKLFGAHFQENFDNILTEEDHHAGTFTGSSLVNWSYFGRNSPVNYINGTSLTLGNSSGYLEGTFYGGIDTLKFTMKRGWTQQGGQVRVLVNDELINTTASVPADGSAVVIKIPINISGSIKLRIERLVNAVVIDDLNWNSYENFEDFDDILAIENHHNGAFTGSSGVDWTYYGRNIPSNYINGTSLMLANADAFLQGNIKGGIDTLKFAIKRGFNATNGVLKVLINGVLIASTTPLPDNYDLVEVAIPIKKAGTLKLRIEHNIPAVVIDDLRWASYGNNFYFESITTSDVNLNELMLTATKDLVVTSLTGLTIKESGINRSVSNYRVSGNKLYIPISTTLKYDTASYVATFNANIANIKSITEKNLIDQFLLKVNTFAFKPQPVATTITKPQAWRTNKDVIDGWDWSLPSETIADTNASALGGLKMPPSLTKLEVASLSWKELEPTEGVYDFQKLRDRLNVIRNHGNKAQLSIKGSVIETEITENQNKRIEAGTSPLWLANITSPDTITKVYWNKKINSPNFAFQITSYNIYDSIYVEKYNRFIRALGDSSILNDDVIDGIYLHGMSGSRGEEASDDFTLNSPEGKAWFSIIQNWANALGSNKGKLAYLGRKNIWLNTAYALGLGQRGGFVEMYLIGVETPNEGSSLDSNGYLLFNDDLVPVKEGRVWDDENEEYGDNWEIRYGTPEVYPHRFKESWMRALQSRRLSLWTGAHTYDPEFSYWCGMELGRKANNSPDAWSYLRESYIANGKEVKNFERWLFQRDLVGYPTVPVHRFNYVYDAVQQDPTRRYDMIGRRGKRFGFGVDDNFISTTDLSGKVAIKVTYQDLGTGYLVLQYIKEGSQVRDSVALSNSGLVKTVTFITDNASFNNTAYAPDFYVSGVNNDTDLTLFMVRIVKIGFAVLPLKLTNFYAEPKLNSVVLHWNTLSETDTDKFTIEKKIDINDFQTIGSVKAKNISGNNFYRFDDNEALTTTTYYRLKMFNQDGTSNYSNIIPVKKKQASSISLYPNPVANELNLNFPEIKKEAQLSVISLDGRTLSTDKISKGISSIKINVSDLTPGVYIIKLNADNQEIARKFIKE